MPKRWIATVVIVLVELFTFAFAAGAVIARHGRASSAGWSCHLHSGRWLIDEVDRPGPAASLQKKDEVLSVDGQRAGWLCPMLRLDALYPGQQYTVTARRGARMFSCGLRMGVDRSISLTDVAATLLFASLFFLAGLWIRLGGAGDDTARLGSATFLLAGIAMPGPVLLTYPGWSLGTATIAVALASAPRPIVMALGWDFLSRFPHKVAEGQTIRLLRRLFYIASALLWAALNLPWLVELAHVPYQPAWNSVEWLGWFGPLGTAPQAAFDSAISAAACYVLIRNYRLLIDRDSRRRIRWAAMSFGIGAVSLLSLRFLQVVSSLTGSRLLAIATRIADAATTVMIGIIPIILAYAVVKHRVLGIRLIIRRGLQYLLARNVLRLILLAPAVIVFIQILRNPNATFSDMLFRSSWRFYLLVMGTAGLSLGYRRELSRWLDRRFFRVALQEEETWVALMENIKAANTEREIAGVVAHQIQLALGVEEIAVYFRPVPDATLRLAFWDGSPSEPLPEVMEKLGPEPLMGNTVVTMLRQSPEPALRNPVEPEAQESVLVPLLGSDGRNLGAILVGPKKSEQPFTRRDRELLQAIGVQVVMACEMLRLRRSVEEESRQRIAVLGRLDRENIQLLSECLQCGDCHDASQKTCPRDGTPLQLTLPVERVVVGRYRLMRRLGAGGMGVVYEAMDLRLDKLVAVKIMVGELFGNQVALARFRREAQVIALLRHPNIVGVHDFGALPAGGAFLVMDLVRGLSWRKHLRSPRLLPPERIANWVEGLCGGVSAAHSRGIVHRDLKPENVMISEGSDREAAMVLDFGVAKLQAQFETDAPDVSVTGVLIGTRAYMSPEQRAGEIVGPATDVYSIGVMTLETLARTEPPNAGATIEWAEQALRRIVPKDSELAEALLAALAHVPELRLQRVDELGRRLSSAIRAEKPLAFATSGPDDMETLSIGAAN